MNIKEIVIAHLKGIGADGLCCDGCGCGVDDLMPCGGLSIDPDCVPAKRLDCDQKCGNGYCDVEGGDCYRPLETASEPEETHL